MAKSDPNYFFQVKFVVFVLPLIGLLSGCASIGKGVAEAVLEKSENEDNRQCQVWGQPFDGIDGSMVHKHGNTKILFVHGVGDHIPGYTTEFMEKLGRELGLDTRSEGQKNIVLRAPSQPGKNLGNLRVTHLLNDSNDRELTFYELTWSEITRHEKDLLAFDNSGDYEFRRAAINSLLKKFSNDTGPDPIIYLGESRKPILAAFTQAFCWMASGDWQSLPNNVQQSCTELNDGHADLIAQDDYVFISHSLGSRIVIDGLQHIAALLAKENVPAPRKKSAISSLAVASLQNKQIPIYMLSNQLPMLQLGRELPEIAGQAESYCDVKGANFQHRMVNETSIIAFSDPNDLLSYGIPAGFSEKYIDSRLCPRITNVNINIAKVMDAFGLSDLANPLDAHVGYDQDDRVVAMIAKGIGTPNAAPLVKKRCEFTKEIK